MPPSRRPLRYWESEPGWLRETRNRYYETSIALEKLIDRICRTDSGMAFHYRVRARTRRST
jgi:hypothetical protein